MSEEQNPVAEKESIMLSEDQIKHMANRFLGWKLPKPFRPDNFITFTPPAPLNPGTPYENDLWPTGTNLFDATQAEQMVRHMVEGLDAHSADDLKQRVADLEAERLWLRDALFQITNLEPSGIAKSPDFILELANEALGGENAE